jgi:hypothetical protein
MGWTTSSHGRDLKEDGLMLESISQSLPEIYQRLLPKFFSSLIPRETKSTCNSCPITKGCEAGLAKLPVQGLYADNKCCSYQPGHVNYLVGGLLLDQDPAMKEGRARMLGRIEKQLGEPYGVSSPMELRELYENQKPGQPRNPKLICDFYDMAASGKCTIWKHRDAVCSTYFCKHERGAVGRALWISLKEYLEVVEDQLSRYATYRVAPELFLLAESRLQGDEEEYDYATIWGDFAGREVEFYQECYRTIANLSTSEVEKITGLDGIIAMDQLIESFQAIQDGQTAQRLQLSTTVETFKLDEETVGVVGYLHSDAVAIPRKTFEALRDFSLRERAMEVCARIAVERGINITPELLQTLVDHRILIGN